MPLCGTIRRMKIKNKKYNRSDVEKRFKTFNAVDAVKSLYGIRGKNLKTFSTEKNK